MPSPMGSSQPRDWTRSPTLQWILYRLSHWGSPRILQWVAYPFLRGFSNPGIKLGSPALQVDSLPAELQGNSIYTYMKWSEMKLLSRVWLFATPWTLACQAPPSMGLSRQEFWSGLPFPSLPGAGEAFRSWQRSWGRRLGIRKGGIEPQESARIFSSISPPQKTESAYFIALCSHLWLYWGLSPTTISLSLSKS